MYPKRQARIKSYACGLFVKWKNNHFHEWDLSRGEKIRLSTEYAVKLTANTHFTEGDGRLPEDRGTDMKCEAAAQGLVHQDTQ